MELRYHIRKEPRTPLSNYDFTWQVSFAQTYAVDKDYYIEFREGAPHLLTVNFNAHVNDAAAQPSDATHAAESARRAVEQ